MRKFLLGIGTGLVLALLTGVVLVLSAIRLGEARPTVGNNSTLILDLSGDLPEKAPVALPLPIPLLQSKTPMTVADIWSTLRRASTDSRVQGLVLQIGRTQAGWAKMNEIRDDVLNFKKSGKPVYALVRNAGMREYYLATAADKIFAAPEDMIDVKGVRAEVTFLKNTLDKLGVQAEVMHVGRFKDAGDMLTKTSITPETRESLGTVLDGIYGSVVNAIAEGRKKSPEEIRAILDEGPFTSKQALSKGLLDALRYEDQVFGDLKTQLKASEQNKVRLRTYQRSLSPETDAKKKVAWVVGEGTILRGSGQDGMGTDEGFTSGAFIRMLRSIASDSSISGVILRVDSPGGDAFASDEMLREIRLLREKKPMVVSFSDYAASGGYYVSMTGDPIVAYPNTLTGSIGVLYARFNLKGLYDKLGIQKDFLLRGKNANIDSDYGPMTPEARAKLQTGLEEFYHTFVTKVSEGRRRKYEEMEPLAQGRVWLGSDAKNRGLVDSLGGIDSAVSLIKGKVGLKDSDRIQLIPYPPKRTLLEQLIKASGESASTEMETRLARLVGVDLRALAQNGYLQLMPFRLALD